MAADLVQLLNKYFAYNPETGIVTHKPRAIDKNKRISRQKSWNTRFANKQAGANHDGYIRISFLGFDIYAHQIAFALMTGKIPIEVDHEDLNKSNNEWINLRDASRSQNASNCKQRKRNKLKLKGVSWSESNNCFRMDIAYKKKKYHSYHKTAEQAFEAYCLKSAELHGEFSNVG